MSKVKPSAIWGIIACVLLVSVIEPRRLVAQDRSVNRAAADRLRVAIERDYILSRSPENRLE